MTPQRPSNFYLILMLGALTALGPFSIDMYLPAFPAISQNFGVQVSEVALSLSSYFIGVAIGQLFYGPLLDRYGRRPPLYGGILLYIFACFGCFLAQGIEVFISFRFLQALGGCVAQVASMAMVRDFFEGKQSAKIFTLIILILGVSPLLAPTLGAYASELWGWRSIFIILTVIAGLLLLMVHYFLPEGRERNPSSSLKFTVVLKNYGSIISHPQFYTYAFTGAFVFSGMFVYLASSPVIFLEIFSVGPHAYGKIFGMMAAGFIGLSQLNVYFVDRFEREKILLVGLSIMFSVAIIFCLGAFFNWYKLSGTIVLLFLFLASIGIINPNASSLALGPFKENAGSASGLLGAIQMSIGALVSGLVGVLHAKEIFPFTLVYVLAISLALISFAIGRRRIK